ncbi:flagellar biosynthesis anti-sigma factor FlgM [Marichromatium bheemlicum]|uniref:Negative regulator of flagellin synthesis n=1 Tax=Marichromatium bheemlicum TaxID=365339 RepID=A0ABX1I7E6_9GAMM|nr:flagellar biosynthesis anti-sigma factor FlgM [Marichromatium bheemlicum]NKN33183.1 flagellar biosynthesis anti-sigma factor FlgM [Marichromatium bheemlicum]
MDIKNLTQTAFRTDGNNSTGSSVRGGGAKAPAGEAPARAGSEGGEMVTLTSAAQSMSAARTDAAEPPVDEAKVAQIKQAIAEGRYPIDNQQLADNIIEFERLLA